MPNDLKYSDWVKSISLNKQYLLDDMDKEEVEEILKSYHPFLINKQLGATEANIFVVNALNIKPWVDKKMHYDFLFYGILKTKPKIKTLKKQSAKKELKINPQQLDAVKKYYGYSNQKAKEAIRVLSSKQIHHITYWFLNKEGGK